MTRADRKTLADAAIVLLREMFGECQKFGLVRQINNLLGTAKRVDSDVKFTIEANQKNLFQKHADLRPSNAQLYLTSFLCDMKNVPVIGALIRGKEAIDGGIDHLKKEIRYWYECEGGKELVGIVLSTVGAILAVVALVVAFTFTGGTILAVIAGVAGIIGAVIGLINSVTNIVTSFQAYGQLLVGTQAKQRFMQVRTSFRMFCVIQISMIKTGTGEAMLLQLAWMLLKRFAISLEL